MKKLSFKTIGAPGLALALIFSGCSQLKKLSREQKGAAIGVAGGAAAGAAIGAKSKNPAVYAIVGSAVGGVTGAVIGKYMDKQAKELEKEIGQVAEIERIGEGIKVTMGSGILFGFDSSELSVSSEDNLEDLAAVLTEYDSTEILVAGHTDDTGSDSYNQKLSERRAEAVARYLVSNGVKRSRLIVMGFGESNPAHSNTTEDGRNKNRRVEMAIVADNQLKKAAEKETKQMSLNSK